MSELNSCSRGNCVSCNNNVIRVQDAIIEDIAIDNRNSFVTISYGVMGDFNVIHMTLVVLIVSRDTIIRDQAGRNLSVRDLRKGMKINAEFSSAMTRSIPPQSNAFWITVLNQNTPSTVSIGVVLNVDTRNNFLLTGKANDLSSQIRFVITDSTIILDKRGNRIQLRDLRIGQVVRVVHADFMTASIPPQTTAFRVQVL